MSALVILDGSDDQSDDEEEGCDVALNTARDNTLQYTDGTERRYDAETTPRPWRSTSFNGLCSAGRSTFWEVLGRTSSLYVIGA